MFCFIFYLNDFYLNYFNIFILIIIIYYFNIYFNYFNISFC